MKKFYLFAAIALAASATMSAKELSFYVQGEKVTPGSSVSVNCLKITYEGEYGRDYEMNPELFIMSDVDASDVVVTAECTNGQVIQLCCGGMCEAGTTVTKTGIELKAGQMLDTECHSIGFTESLTEKIKSVEAKISAYYASDLSSKIEFNLTMEGEDGAGVEGIVADTEVVETRWYNLQGVQMQERPDGLALKWERLSDGQVRTSRVLNRR